MTHRRSILRAGTLVFVLCACSLAAAPRAARTNAVKVDEPETVMVTLHAKAGHEADAVRVLGKHWETARRLNLVRDTPHLTLRSDESGNTASFVEIFTWRDRSIPDRAPEAIRKIWDEMNAVAEARAGRPALEIVEVSIVGERH